ncbi:N-acetylmuramic acid 6-phosphate etherase [Enterobacter cancerogenus]|uniref:N-acetylmuramic acid 6-phosphate etherase n=1 Tax=Enterobacter cancerogenus TaxID=69218 RepID=UPI001928D0C1|nr:N-acetylmuramic acid 6-phosphate etherase [Enterobacter cancerogenus]EKS7427138.1 N-acetylmuramic acid 6-phosphate etherase [Enterobacter cancerogenus]CAD5353390.1 putative PTS component; possibly regulatory [Enterobacter cancerogenus]HBI6867556.1 N-acetylmuramic acid 6-phosphate etherase [Enterobacter cancerogenus]
MTLNIARLMTEGENPASMEIDRLSTLGILQVINDEDKKVAFAVEQCLPQITAAVEIIFAAVKKGGRLFYIGAGTSGRLGVLDASECPPTYGVSPDIVKGIIAGGMTALTNAVEGAEDSVTEAITELDELGFCDKDVLVGIAASGRTPYVVAALDYAKNSIKSSTIAISCNPNSAISMIADVAITPIVGPEVVTGSSRMKAGTAQKLILNMLSTALMIKLGKVYGNLMVDVVPTNKKLTERQINIVCKATACSRDQAEKALSFAHNNCKQAIVMIIRHCSAEDAMYQLNKWQGYTRLAIADGEGK